MLNVSKKETVPPAMTEIAIIGAGPYGLSIAAHLRGLGIPFRVFGRPMDSWRCHMPEGMQLKSDGFASNISDPNREFTLGNFCASRQFAYSPLGLPVAVETFSAYGMAFQERMVPELEDDLVTGVDKVADGFKLCLESGAIATAKRVVMAVGITHFKYIPAVFRDLPQELVSHSFDHRRLGGFAGKSVSVIGGGSSATDLAALLNEKGANVRLIARVPELVFHRKHGVTTRRSLWERMRRPHTGLGPGLKSKFYSEFPHWFRLLPSDVRVDIVGKFLGPAGGWFMKDRVIGRFPLLLGQTIESASERNGKVHLRLRSADGAQQEIVSDHVVAATGYRPNVSRLAFLSENIRANIKTLVDAPILSSSFESSVSGLHFVGLASALSFGPLMRFAYGADFAARHFTGAIAKSFARKKVAMKTADAMSVAE